MREESPAGFEPGEKLIRINRRGEEAVFGQVSDEPVILIYFRRHRSHRIERGEAGQSASVRAKLVKDRIGFEFIAVFAELTLFSALSERYTQRRKISSEYLKQHKGYYDDTMEALEYLRSVDRDFYRIDKNYRSVYLNDALFQNFFGTKSYYSSNSPSYLNFIKALNVPLKSLNGCDPQIMGALGAAFYAEELARP